MKKRMLVRFVVVALVSCFLGSAWAQGPCEQIKSACLSAGFIPKDYKQGKGLWRDCIDPIMQGSSPANATLPLPVIAPNVVAACKAKHPNFGEGKVGSP